MSKLSVDDVSHVARLSKLTLSKSELPKFQKELSEIVNYISELGEVDTNGVEPTAQTTNLTNITRPDANVSQSISPEEALSGTEETLNNYFVVPALINKENE